MARRPRALTLLSTFYFALAVGLPLQVMVLYGHGWTETAAVLAKLTWLNLLLMGSLLASAILLLRASPRARKAVIGTLALTVANNFVAGYYATDFSMLTTALASAAFACCNLPLLDPKVQWLLEHPGRRWWLRAERTRVTVPVLIEGMRLESVHAHSFDMSETGVFVPLEGSLGVGDRITLNLKFGDFTHFRTQGRVVRREEAKGRYPAGVGIQFMDLSRRQRRDLRRVLSSPAGLA